jgi:ferredoxin, 2Fe-2S
MAIIKFTFEDKNLAPVELQAKRGDTILDIAEDNDIHINSNCGAVCACSTCHIYVQKGDQYLPEISDREEDFIDRAISPRITSRLSCQCALVKDSDDAIIEVYIPDQSRIIGHEH